MNELLYKGNLVRTLGDYSNPLFLAKDICEILEISVKNVTRILDEDEVYSVRHVDSKNRRQEMLVLTESGLYHLALKSRKEVGKKFRRWITQEVIPQLRKQGFYVAQGMNPELAQVAQGRALKARAAELKREAAELEEQASRLLTIRDGMTVREALEEDDMLFDEMYLLRAANMMARIAKKEGIPSGLRGRTRTYPRQTLFSVLGINQTEMSFSAEGRN